MWVAEPTTEFHRDFLGAGGVADSSGTIVESGVGTTVVGSGDGLWTEGEEVWSVMAV
jgi:hypothetical protein